MNKLTILLAEDCRPDVYLVRKALTDAGLDYELLVVEDRWSTESFFHRPTAELPDIDLLLVDLNLPGITGAEIIAMLRSRPACASVPVIVITSSDSPAERARMAELKVACYFCKPSDLEEFMHLGHLVRTVLQIPPLHRGTSG